MATLTFTNQNTPNGGFPEGTYQLTLNAKEAELIYLFALQAEYVNEDDDSSAYSPTYEASLAIFDALNNFLDAEIRKNPRLEYDGIERINKLFTELTVQIN